MFLSAKTKLRYKHLEFNLTCLLMVINITGKYLPNKFENENVMLQSRGLFLDSPPDNLPVRKTFYVHKDPALI